MDYLLFILSQTRPTQLDVIATPPLVAVLIWLSVTDWQSFRLPDAGTLPLIMCGLLLAVWRDGSVPVDQVIGTVAGFAVFWAIGAAYFRARGIDALGLGDSKLLAAAGAWMGWQALPSMILISSITGIAVALVRGGDSSANIPFGPSLALAFFLHWALFLSGWL
ncbi:prepilin peptidase [Roseobacter sp. GAI101]|nr:prepilin peptidase [Roseobacter sp. GAI101]